MKYQLIFLFILSVLFSQAQTKDKPIIVGRVVSDTTTLNATSDNWESILRSKNAIEIRLISSAILSESGYLALIYTTKWKAIKVYFDKSKNSFISKELVVKGSISSIVEKLISNNVFCLPDQADIKLEKLSFDPKSNVFGAESMGISDGVNYSVEFKVGDKFRRYTFTEPENYLKFYRYSNELKNYMGIVKAFRLLSTK